MEMIDIVRKLIGPVAPIGETNADNQRFENLKALTELVERLVFDIDQLVIHKTHSEYSMKRAGAFAEKFLTDLGIED
jgi:hypothetical protein